jgi:SAM-dependent methyltransferase
VSGEDPIVLSDSDLRGREVMAERAFEDERGAWRAAGIRSGAHVADIGCGHGVMLAELARIVGPAGGVVGVDRSLAALATAQDRTAAMGLNNVRVKQGTADATGLECESQDVVFMRHVLLRNGARLESILDHVAWLLRPGGHAYLAETDLTGLRWGTPLDPDLVDLADRWMNLLERDGNDIQVGIRLGALVRRAGLQLADCSAYIDSIVFSADRDTRQLRGAAWAARAALVTAGLATWADVERWGAAFIRRETRADLQNAVFVPIYTVTARKPDCP